MNKNCTFLLITQNLQSDEDGGRTWGCPDQVLINFCWDPCVEGPSFQQIHLQSLADPRWIQADPDLDLDRICASTTPWRIQ